MARSPWALVGLAALLLAAGPGASAASAGLWSAPVTLGPAGASTLGDVDVQPDGTAVVGWAASGGPVRAAVRPAGTAFGTTQTLAPDGGQVAAAALDGRGGALVAWSRNGALGLAERTLDAPELTEVPIAMTAVQSGPDVAFTGAGRAIVVWAGPDGAIHALSRVLGGDTAALPDLAAGPGNVGPHLAAAGDHAVAAWTNIERVGSQTTTRVQAAVLAASGSFGPAEDVASSISDSQSWSGSEVTATGVAVSPPGAADLPISRLGLLGIPGEAALAGLVAARPMGTWQPPQHLGGASGLVNGAQYVSDLAAGAGGDALYVDGTKPPAPEMTFSARRRAEGAASYGEPSTLHSGAPGEILAAPLATGRFLVLMRSGSGLRSRAGSTTPGFEDPLVFSGTDATRLLALAGAPSGLAAAAWVTAAGTIHAVVYDDSLGRASLPPTAGRDTVAPVLSRLSVSPRRFAVRRRTRPAARIRWRLSEPARVTLHVDRARPGFRRGERCVARRPRTGRIRRCTRFTRVGSFTRTRQAGRARVRFNGFVTGRRLHAGRHRLTAIPRDAAGNRGKARRAAFRVLRRG